MSEHATPALRIAARREIRRAGMRHPETPTEHPAGTFPPAALEALEADPMLIVDRIEPARPPRGKGA